MPASAPAQAGGPPAKVVHELPGGDPPPLEPGALVLLGERGGDGRAEALEPTDALVSASAHLMHAGGRDAAARAFAALAGLLGAVPALRVSMPDDLDRLPDAAAETRVPDRRCEPAARGIGSGLNREPWEPPMNEQTPYEAPLVEELEVDGDTIATTPTHQRHLEGDRMTDSTPYEAPQVEDLEVEGDTIATSQGANGSLPPG